MHQHPQLQEEITNLSIAIEAVAEGYPVYLELLQHHDPQVQCMGAYLIAV